MTENKNKPEIKRVTRKPWALTYFEKNQVYNLSKMYINNSGIRYANLYFKIEEIPQLARTLVKLTKFKQEFNKAKKELKQNDK